jgi:nucleotide-binding universal stress UspA family protein
MAHSWIGATGNYHSGETSSPRAIDIDARVPYGAFVPRPCKSVAMSATTALLIFFVVWAAIGISAAILMGRRGHSPAVWAFVGAILGPLVIPLMIQAIRREATTPTAQVHAPRTHGGTVDLAVGVDGSDEATAALQLVIRLFRPIVGRLTVATVVSYDAGASNAPPAAQREARELLDQHARLAAELLGGEPDTVLLTGRPADALAQYAREGDYDLLVVGSRGRGASRLLFGSVASTLAQGVGIPVVIVPATALPPPR